MSVAVPPTDYMKHNLDPLSHKITSYGGPHVLMGLIASGGKPHIYIVGNVEGNLKKEIYLALSDKLRERANAPQADKASPPVSKPTLVT